MISLLIGLFYSIEVTTRVAPSLTSNNDDLTNRLCSEPYVTGGQPEDSRLVVLDSEVPAPDYTEGKMSLHNVKQHNINLMLQNVAAHNVRVPKRKVFKT